MSLCGSFACGCGLTVVAPLSLSGSGQGGDPWVIRGAGEVAYAETTADPAAGIGAAPSDIAGMSLTFLPVIGRKYMAITQLRVAQVTSAGIQECAIRDSGGATRNKSSQTIAAGDIGWHVVHYRWIETFGANLTLKTSVSTTAGTADPFASTVQPAFIQVIDLGV